MFFDVRLTETGNADDCIVDVSLPSVPSVGDTIELFLAGKPLGAGIYRVLARRFVVHFDREGRQITGDGQPQQVLVHVSGD